MNIVALDVMGCWCSHKRPDRDLASSSVAGANCHLKRPGSVLSLEIILLAGNAANVSKPLFRTDDNTNEQHDSVRSWRAPCKGGAFQWVQAPPGNRSSRKQSE